MIRTLLSLAVAATRGSRRLGERKVIGAPSGRARGGIVCVCVVCCVNSRLRKCANLDLEGVSGKRICNM